MWGLWFVPAMLEMLCLIGSFICGISGIVMLIEAISQKTRKGPKSRMILVWLVVMVLFCLAAFLDWVWQTQLIFGWKMFSFA